MKIKKIVDTIKKTTDKIMDASVPTINDIKKTFIINNKNVFEDAVREKYHDQIEIAKFSSAYTVTLCFIILIQNITNVLMTTNDTERYNSMCDAVHEYESLKKYLEEYDDKGIIGYYFECVPIYGRDGKRISFHGLMAEFRSYITEHAEEEVRKEWTIHFDENGNIVPNNEDKKSE